MPTTHTPPPKADEPTTQDTHFMRQALHQALRCHAHGDVPVGAVLVREGVVIARGRNRREQRADPTAHAELEALRRAAKRLGGWHLAGCTLYVTLEPCPMCAGAILQARIPRVVYGAPDTKAGCLGSKMDFTQAGFPMRVEVTANVLRDECAALLRDFFARRRKRPAPQQPIKNR